MISELVQKLKIKAGMNLLILNAPDGYLSSEKEIPLEIGIDTEVKTERYPFVQLFVKNKVDLKEQAEQAIQAVEYDGLLWICYPKKSSSLFEDLTRDEGWEPVKSKGFEGVAAIAIDENWSAIRYRPKDEIKQKKRSTPSKNEDEPVQVESMDTVPNELVSILETNPKAKAAFEGLAPSYKRSYIEWIVSAKRKETKEKRLKETVSKLEEGYKNPYAK